jgi:hypothetical protein
MLFRATEMQLICERVLSRLPEQLQPPWVPSFGARATPAARSCSFGESSAGTSRKMSSTASIRRRAPFFSVLLPIDVG